MAEVAYELNCHNCGNVYTVSYVQDLVDTEEPLYCPFCSYDTDLSDLDDDACYDDKYSDFTKESIAKED